MGALKGKVAVITGSTSGTGARTAEVRAFGDALWYACDYFIEMPKQTLSGHGFAMCRRNGKRWRMLNLHNSFAEPPKEARKP